MKNETRAIIITMADGSKWVESYAYPGPCIGSPATPEQIYNVFASLARLSLDSPPVSYLPLEGLQQASDDTCDWPRTGYVSIVRCDLSDGRVWTTDATDDQLAGPYDVLRTSRHVSPDEIVTAIQDRLRI